MSAPPEPFRRDGSTWLAYGLLAYYSFMLNVLGPVLPFLQREQGLSATLSSLHASALALGMLVASLAGPGVVARLGRRGTLWLGGAGLTAASLALTLSRHPLGTLLSAGAMGALGTLILVVIPALLVDLHPARQASALSEANVGGSLGAALAPLLVGAAGALTGDWRVAVLAGAAGFGLLAAGLARPAAVPAARGPAQAGAGGRLPGRYWRYWLVLVLVVAVEFALIFWVASFLAGVRGWDVAAAATASATFPLLMVIGRAGGAAVTRRYAPVPVLYASLALALAGVLLVWMSPLPLATLAGLALAGVGVANLYPLTLAQALAAAPAQSALASARAALASGGAILTSPLLLGALADRAGLLRGFGVIPVAILVAVAVLAYATRTPGPRYGARPAAGLLPGGHER